MARLGVPPGVALSESTRKLAHSKRFVNAKAPWESKQRMEYGGLPPLCEAGQGETWPPTGVEAGPPKGRNHHELKQGRSGRERQEGHCTRETVAQEGGLASGVPAGEEGSECATVERRGGAWGGGFELQGRATCVAADRPVFSTPASEVALLGLETFWRNERQPRLFPMSVPPNLSKN